MPLTSLPNLLTLSRIVAIPLVIATLLSAGAYGPWFGCALFSAAGRHRLARRPAGAALAAAIRARPVPRPDRRQAAGRGDVVHAGGVRPASRRRDLSGAGDPVPRNPGFGTARVSRRAARGVPVSRLAKWKTAIQMVAIGLLIVGDAGPSVLPVAAIGEIAAVARRAADPRHRLRLFARRLVAHHPAAPRRRDRPRKSRIPPRRVAAPAASPK